MGKIDELVEALGQDMQSVKPAPHPFMLGILLVLVAFLYLVLLLLFSGFRPDILEKLHSNWFLVEITLLIGLLVFTSISASTLSFPDLYQMRWAAVTPVWIFGLLASFLLAAWTLDSPPAPLPKHSFQCTLDIGLLSLLPGVWIFYLLRKFASTHFRLTGSIAVLYAFSTGAIWLRLYEKNDSILHVIEWHYLPMIGFGIAGLWLGKKLLRW